MQIKKYANRRLYDTGTSRYVTLEEIAERVRAGEEISVVDAATGGDLTQATLTQIILESRGAGKLLPVPLLVQLVRLGDDALAEFFGRWVSWALEVYVHGRSGLNNLQQLNPFAGFPGQGFSGQGGFPMGGWGWPYGGPTWDPSRGPVQSPTPAPPSSGAPVPPPPAASPAAPANPAPANATASAPSPDPAEDLAALRRELEELKAGMRKRGKKS